MLKKTKLSWGTRSDIESEPIKGYYDTAEPWHMIENIYLSHTMAKKMIRNMSTVEGKPTHLRWDDKTLLIGNGKAQIAVNSEEILVEDDHMVVYKLPTQLVTPGKVWFDWSLEHDATYFFRSDLYTAVYQSLQVGIQLGLTCEEKIDGLTLHEFANRYASEAKEQ